MLFVILIVAWWSVGGAFR